MDLGPRGSLARCGHTLKVTRCAAAGQAVNDPVATLDRVIDRVVEIGERRPKLLHGLLDTIASRRHARQAGALDVVGRVDLVDQPKVALVQDLERDPLDHLQVRGHVEPPFCVRVVWRFQVWGPRWRPPGLDYPGDWSGVDSAE